MVIRDPGAGQSAGVLGVTQSRGGDVEGSDHGMSRLFMTTIVWFRRDLRLTDHGALAAAHQREEPVLPVFVWDPAIAPWAPGAASRVWLHHSLEALDRDLRARGCPLLLRVGDPVAVLEALVRETGAGAIAYSRRHEPAERALEAALQARLGARVTLLEHDDGLLADPALLRTADGQPYRVFTPFWRRLRETVSVAPAGSGPAQWTPPVPGPTGVELDTLGLLPRPRWDRTVVAAWGIGEAAARARLASFIAEGVERYAARRDLPAVDGVSRLSPHLHFGEVSPRQVWRAVSEHAAMSGRMTVPESALGWLRQLGWREFAQHLLHHFPATVEAPMREAFAHFPWREDAAGLTRWQRGETGYPIVDAGMRELWQTGWMHNRVRMIVASFLTKDLGVHWLAGARWFWDTLVDADLANNTLGWQWVAGCGADAAPYFRVFNPVLQSAKFDPDGDYLRRWLPELARLQNADLHAPWQAGDLSLAAAGVRLGLDYPSRLLDHSVARAAALARLKRSRR